MQNKKRGRQNKTGKATSGPREINMYQRGFSANLTGFVWRHKKIFHLMPMIIKPLYTFLLPLLENFVFFFNYNSNLKRSWGGGSGLHMSLGAKMRLTKFSQ